MSAIISLTQYLYLVKYFLFQCPLTPVQLNPDSTELYLLGSLPNLASVYTAQAICQQCATQLINIYTEDIHSTVTQLAQQHCKSKIVSNITYTLILREHIAIELYSYSTSSVWWEC